MEREEFRWLSKMFVRVLDAVSLKSKLPLLCLSFAQKFPNACLISNLPRDLNMTELSKATPYAVILYLLKEINFSTSNPVDLFRMILTNLKVLGYAPKPPCDVMNLVHGRIIDHANLCSVLARAIFEKSLHVERVVEDLKRLPSSFFVLSDVPFDTDVALSLWLRKFHCIPGLSDTEDLNTFAHVAGALSRVFPSRVRRSEVQFRTGDFELNKQRVFSVLNEIGAYMPLSFPVNSDLFNISLVDLFYATRQSVKSFVRVDAPMPIAGLRPVTAKPARVKRVTSRARAVVRPSTRKAVVRLPLPQRKGEADELGEIYHFMSHGERKSSFIQMEDPKALIDSLVKLMNLDENEHTFANLQLSLHGSDDMPTHMHNGIAFLKTLSGSNNEFQASKKVVFFARRMMKTVLGLRPMTTAGRGRRNM